MALGVAPKNSEVEMTCAAAGRKRQAASSSATRRTVVFMVRQRMSCVKAKCFTCSFSGEPRAGVTRDAEFSPDCYLDSICPGTSSPPVAASSSSRATAQKAIAPTSMRRPRRTKCSFASSTRLLAWICCSTRCFTS